VGRTAKSIFFGIAVGAIGTILVRRILQVIRDDNPEVLIDRIADQLNHLENRLGTPERRPA